MALTLFVICLDLLCINTKQLQNKLLQTLHEGCQLCLNLFIKRDSLAGECTTSIWVQPDVLHMPYCLIDQH